MNEPKYGYRSEVPFGEGYRDAVAVIKHEIFELGNDDILVTLRNDILRDNQEIMDELILRIQHGRANLPDNIATEFCQLLVHAVSSTVGKDINYVLWLCPTKADVYLYELMDMRLQDSDIDTYETSDVIFANLGQEGCLYGYTELPEKVLTVE
jgi:hypothetical protein